MKSRLFIFFRILVALSWVTTTSSSFGEHTTTLASIANHPRWLRLLHYEQNLTGPESLVDNELFFFSPVGKFDPLAELLASRAAIQTGQPDRHPEHLDPICAFPARARFMQEVLGDTLRTVPCDGIEYWKSHLPLRSVSVVFSTAYSGNPASLFGHTFVKLNVQPESLHPQNYTVSFAAIPDDSMPYLYMLKGMTGQYPGVFHLVPFYEKNTEYVELESRDLWEYELNLSSKQRMRFLEHVFELYANANVDYYFLHDNCSYALLAALNVVDDGLDLTSSMRQIVFPHETVRALSKVPGLVRKVEFHPSQRRRFYAALNNLGTAETNQLDQQLFKDPSPRALACASPDCIDTAIAYYQFKTGIEHKRTTGEQARLNTILEQRSDLTIAPKPLTLLPASNRPDLGHGPMKTTVASQNLRDAPGTLLLRHRYGFHDLLDDHEGYEDFLAINMLSLEAQIPKAGDPQLTKLQLVDILSVPNFDQYDPTFGFRLYTGLQAPTPANPNFYFGLGGGLAVHRFSSQLLFYAFPTIFAQTDLNTKVTAVSPHLSFAALAQFYRYSKTLLEVDWMLPLLPQSETRHRIALTQALHWSDWQIHFKWFQDGIEVGGSYYY